MPNQRSILSFFSSSSPSSPELPKPQPQLQPKPARQAPPPPPPPSIARFVPPPSARNDGPAYTVPPGMTAQRFGGSPAPNLDLPPIAPAYGQSILQAAGATVDADGNIFFAAGPSSGQSKIVLPRDVHVPDLVSVNSILLPVRYPDSFYKVVADNTRVASLFNRVILGDDGKVVGGVVCRLEPSPFALGDGLAVYIQSLALLSPYRGRGLMAAVLESIVATVRALNSAASAPASPLVATGPIFSLYAHVWTEHDDALQWYKARQFLRQGDAPINDYYFALRPNTAWIVRLDVVADKVTATGGVMSQLAALQTSQKTKEAALPPPPPSSTSAPPPLSRTTTSQSQSYQNSRPETEWNDMPAEMLAPSGGPSANGSASVSVASSRNPSRKVSRINLADGQAAEGDEDSGPPTSALLSPPLPNGSQASSRSSSSTGRKKRERAYPAAMFQ
ncbi:hypothetical protein SEUCBS139899_007181 [Sporothrix eucalyptigena]|uniref:N-acetyltransferase domain-containing protein n=1 Tax=Sporothrix eucalyptigena TaxID=1812306 RepID=A0ABP0C3N8_9PEZI